VQATELYTIPQNEKKGKRSEKRGKRKKKGGEKEGKQDSKFPIYD
jgi:hypothetical protein